jgi:hypothetical protein
MKWVQVCRVLVKKFRAPQNFLSSCATVSFSVVTPIRGGSYILCKRTPYKCLLVLNTLNTTHRPDRLGVLNV